MFKQRYIIYIVGFIYFLILCFCNYNNNVLISSAIDLETVDLEQDSVIEQNFVVNYNNMVSVGINTATCLREKMEGTITIQLNLDGLVIVEKDIPINNFLDNYYYYLDIPLQKNSKGKNYQLIVKGKYIPEETTLKIYANKVNEEMVLNIGYFYQGKDSTLIVYPILYVWLIALIEVFNVKSERKSRK